jgi:hypothetical protein
MGLVKPHHPAPGRDHLEGDASDVRGATNVALPDALMFVKGAGEAAEVRCRSILPPPPQV